MFGSYLKDAYKKALQAKEEHLPEVMKGLEYAKKITGKGVKELTKQVNELKDDLAYMDVESTLEAWHIHVFKDADFEFHKIPLQKIPGCPAYPEVYISDFPFPNKQHLFKKFQSNVLILNLSEKQYSLDQANIQIKRMQFPGFPCIPLQDLAQVCSDIVTKLVSGEIDTIVCHCFRGYTRSAIFYSCLLTYMGMFSEVVDALCHICQALKVDDTAILPSQRRYLDYFYQTMMLDRSPVGAPLILNRIVINDVISIPEGDSVYLEIFSGGLPVYSSRDGDNIKPFQMQEGVLCLDVGEPVLGDVLVRFRSVAEDDTPQSILRIAFNVDFCHDTHFLHLPHSGIDFVQEIESKNANSFVDILFSAHEDGDAFESPDYAAIFDEARKLGACYRESMDKAIQAAALDKPIQEDQENHDISDEPRLFSVEDNSWLNPTFWYNKAKVEVARKSNGSGKDVSADGTPEVQPTEVTPDPEVAQETSGPQTEVEPPTFASTVRTTLLHEVESDNAEASSDLSDPSNPSASSCPSRSFPDIAHPSLTARAPVPASTENAAESLQPQAEEPAKAQEPAIEKQEKPSEPSPEEPEKPIDTLPEEREEPTDQASAVPAEPQLTFQESTHPAAEPIPDPPVPNSSSEAYSSFFDVGIIDKKTPEGLFDDIISDPPVPITSSEAHSGFFDVGVTDSKTPEEVFGDDVPKTSRTPRPFLDIPTSQEQSPASLAKGFCIVDESIESPLKGLFADDTVSNPTAKEPEKDLAPVPSPEAVSPPEKPKEAQYLDELDDLFNSLDF